MVHGQPVLYSQLFTVRQRVAATVSTVPCFECSRFVDYVLCQPRPDLEYYTVHMYSGQGLCEAAADNFHMGTKKQVEDGSQYPIPYRHQPQIYYASGLFCTNGPACLSFLLHYISPSPFPLTSEIPQDRVGPSIPSPPCTS
jgi:hypothetical protein